MAEIQELYKILTTIRADNGFVPFQRTKTKKDNKLVKQMITNNLFDIKSPEYLYNSLSIEISYYKNRKEKSIGNLLYIILGLTHLREWIAEGYDYEKKPQKPSEYFFQLIYKQNSFTIIRELNNKNKHFKDNSGLVEETKAIHIENVLEWEDVLSVLNVFGGPVSNYIVKVQGKDIDIIVIIDEVFNFYRDKWFENKDRDKLKDEYYEVFNIVSTSP